MDESTIFRAATILLDCYGDAAPMEAALRHERAKAMGDVSIANAWTRVGKLIAAQQAGHGMSLN